ncbi:MAG: putative sugar nucleotidyl transferase [Chitinophagaceae bacterium]|nr:putative sugar nucleotidyl transferase [Chitinophagaceae bacterium]
MSSILFTEEFCQPENLYPFTLTRQIQDIRVGILTIREKWERMLGMTSFDRNENDYKDLDRSRDLADCVEEGECFLIHGNVLPDTRLVRAVKKLKAGEFLSSKGSGIVYRVSKKRSAQPPPGESNPRNSF